jgi:ubiquinone biosynthesis protein COQ4
LTLQSATTALNDPTRADAVAQLGELTGHVALTSMYNVMMQNNVGQQILRERPIVSKETLPASIEMMMRESAAANKSAESPSSSNITFGQAYGAFLKKHGFDPDERSEVQYIDNPELAYVMTRYRQCHDYWHVLTDLPPTVVGELGLKWLELLQFHLPVAALSATVGSLRLNNAERELLFQHYLPWAVRMSRQSEYLLNVYYEQEFDTPLEELRDRLRIEPAPKL